MQVADAAEWADVVMMLTPDELQAEIYNESLVDNMKDGAALMFALAAFVEAFWSPLTSVPYAMKIGAGLAGWGVLLAYFALSGRASAAR